jgi:SAM-dependent methyltransferase
MDTAVIHDNGTLDAPPHERGFTDPSPLGEPAGTVGCSPVPFTRADLTPETRGQCGEVETLADLIAYYGAENHWMVDVGAHDGVLFSNSAAFRQHGWNVIGVEMDTEAAKKAADLTPPMYCVINAEVQREGGNSLDRLIESACGPHNEGGVPKDFDILSIDIDGMDYHIWDSLKNYRPRIVCIEVADFAGPFADGEFVPEYGQPLEREKHPPLGAPPTYILHEKRTTCLSMSLLAKRMGYTPVAVTRYNAIYVRDDVVATKPLKLNLGGQGSFLPGFINVDALVGTKVFPLPYADGSVSEIYASHILEHFSHRQTLDVLREWVRVLEPDGLLRVAVPDYDKITDPKIVSSFDKRMMYLFGGHCDRFDRHGALFTEQSLTAQLRFVGIDFVRRWESDLPDCAAYDISLNLGGIKRAFTIKENPSVVAVISQPRLIFADGATCLHRGLRAVANKAVYLGQSKPPVLDDMVYCGGAFWEKFLTGGIKTAIQHGADYLLFTDYDSVFSPEDALNLIDVLNKDLSVSAAFAVQASRHNDAALVQMDFINYEGEQTPVQLGHFGLTAIRAEVFRDLPKPWLWSMPHPETGEWDEKGSCDADITFWRVLAEHGHKVVQVNSIQAGHMVLAVKWLTPKGVMYQPIEHYRSMGRPKEAVFNAEAVLRARQEKFLREQEERNAALLAEAAKPEEVTP